MLQQKFLAIPYPLKFSAKFLYSAKNYKWKYLFILFKFLYIYIHLYIYYIYIYYIRRKINIYIYCILGSFGFCLIFKIESVSYLNLSLNFHCQECWILFWNITAMKLAHATFLIDVYAALSAATAYAKNPNRRTENLGEDHLQQFPVVFCPSPPSTNLRPCPLVPAPPGCSLFGNFFAVIKRMKLLNLSWASILNSDYRLGIKPIANGCFSGVLLQYQQMKLYRAF